MNIFRGHRPDVTPAQAIAAVFAAVPPILVLIGVHASPDQTHALDQLKWVALGLFASDAVIRVGRNHADAKRDAAALSASTEPPADPEAHDDDLPGELLGGDDTEPAPEPESRLTPFDPDDRETLAP